MFRYAYLHGLASSPGAFKGVRLAEAFSPRGVSLERPDLNAPSFAGLTCTAMLGVLDAMDAAAGPEVRWRFIGSSLGGYLAALWCHRNPGRCESLMLLCPGFGLHDNWASLVGADGLESWRREGVYPIPDATGRPVPVHYGLVQDMELYPRVPDVDCPTLILHGTRDEVVPVDVSRRYAQERSHVRLIEVDDDHPLHGSVERIEAEAVKFFDLGQ